jgi:hypothetical protein
MAGVYKGGVSLYRRDRDLAAAAFSCKQHLKSAKGSPIRKRGTYNLVEISIHPEKLIFFSCLLLTVGELLFPHFFTKHTSPRRNSVGTQAN